MNTLHISIILVFSFILVITGNATESFALNFESARERFLPHVNATELNLIITNSSEFKDKTEGYQYSFGEALYRLGYNQNNTYTIQSVDVVYSLSGIGNSQYFRTLVVTMDPSYKIRDLTDYNPWHVPNDIPILRASPSILLPANYSVNFDINKLVNVMPPTPINQVRHGVAANDVDCFDGMYLLDLIFKAEDKSPACVRDYTARSLIERGWAMPQNQESISVIGGSPADVELKNETVIATVPIYIAIKNFQPASVPLRIQITYPNGTLFKTDEISSDSIPPDGHYKYELTISSSDAQDVFGRHRIFINHGGNGAETSVMIAAPAETSESSLRNVCGQFYTAPENQRDLKTVPVLLMNTNSTGCARLSFTIDYSYNGTAWPRIASFAPILFIGNVHYSTNGNSFSMTPGKDYTNSFKITVMPETIDLANYPVGSKFSVTYIIRPLPNATGFYDQSIPKLVCERYPLAVGFTADQVNASDFNYIYPLNPPCESGPYELTGVEISGMNYKWVTLP